MVEFPSVWKHAKLRTQEDSLKEALNKHGGSVQCGSSHWLFSEEFKAAACLRQCMFSYLSNSDLEMKQKVNSNHVPVTTMATNSTSVNTDSDILCKAFFFLKIGSCLAEKPSGRRDGPTSQSHGSGSTCPYLHVRSPLLSSPRPPSSRPVLNPAHSRMVDMIQNAITDRKDDLRLPRGLGQQLNRTI